MTEYRAPEQDVVISSRVRLARNYRDIPFAPQMNQDWSGETIRRVNESMKDQQGDYRLVRIAELNKSERNQLVEHHLISYDLLKFEQFSAALISSGETVSIMINEEDHLRIQGLLPGMQLERAADLAFKADDVLGADGNYAFDTQWGYLTSCPTNTGTGMRASTMLHLPALSAAGQVSAVLQTVSKLGLTVRGLYGEGSDAKGNLYQLSNQVTLGRTEEDMVKTLIAATAQLADHERSLRETVREDDSMSMLDKLMRSVGIMGHARLMSSAEFMQRYSDLRLLAAMDIVDASLSEMDQLMMDLQHGSLNVRAGEKMSGQERDVYRAELLRDYIRGIATK
ncbi:protein arginine kinase [Eubacteriales bacterium OttesenSCG-928-N13]|nr:protein arginine kinase [Eubacteriales bacterium OttesenSCG-928-N13]